MMPVLPQLQQGARVAVVRLRSLGDCVLSTPALALLHEFRPDLQIAVVVEPAFADVYRGSPAVAQILAPSLTGLLRWRPELCVNLHGGTRSLLMTALSGARFRAGFAHYRGRRWYNVLLPRAQEVLHLERVVHTAEHVASAMFYLGVPPQPIPRARLYPTGGPTRPAAYAVLHPFASRPNKTWSVDGFVMLAAYLRNEWQVEPIFLGGPRDDLSPFSGFPTAAGQPLAETMALIAGASLFVGNDSGPAHIAAAHDIPLVVLFGPSNPNIWSPWCAEHAEVVTTKGPLAKLPLSAVLQAVESCWVSA